MLHGAQGRIHNLKRKKKLKLLEYFRKMLIPPVSLEEVEILTGAVILRTQTATVSATILSVVMTTAVEEDTTTTASTGLRPCSAVWLIMGTWQSQAARRSMILSRKDLLCVS